MISAIEKTIRIGDLSETHRVEFGAPRWQRAAIIGTLGYIAAGILVLTAVIAHGVARKHGIDLWL